MKIKLKQEAEVSFEEVLKQQKEEWELELTEIKASLMYWDFSEKRECIAGIKVLSQHVMHKQQLIHQIAAVTFLQEVIDS